MNNFLRLLTILLVGQVALVLIMTLKQDRLATFQPHEPLLGVGVDQADEILLSTVDDGKSSELHLLKKDGRWVLPAISDYPVADDKIASLASELLSVSKPWPVGTTKISEKQFKTSDKDYERKIELKADGKSLGGIYLGTSPSFKKVHVRPFGEDMTYVIDYSSYQITSKPADWINKDLLVVDELDVAKLKFKDWTIENSDDGLVVHGLAENEETNKSQVQSLVSKLARLQVTDVYGTEEKPEFKMSEPILNFSITTKGNETIDYVVAGPYEVSYVLKTSKYPYYFKYPKAIFEPLLEINREKLVQSKKAEGGSDKTTNQEGASADQKETK